MGFVFSAFCALALSGIVVLLSGLPFVIAFFFFFFFFQGRSCLTGDSIRPQRKACKTSVTAPPPKERVRKGVPRTEQRARTQAETDGHSARDAEVCQTTH